MASLLHMASWLSRTDYSPSFYPLPAQSLPKFWYILRNESILPSISSPVCKPLRWNTGMLAVKTPTTQTVMTSGKFVKMAGGLLAAKILACVLAKASRHPAFWGFLIFQGRSSVSAGCTTEGAVGVPTQVGRNQLDLFHPSSASCEDRDLAAAYNRPSAG